MRLLAIWIINALALLALPYVVPSVHVASFGTALIVALVLGLINAVLRPLLILLTLPVTLLTLGPARLGGVQRDFLGAQRGFFVGERQVIATG